MPGTDPAPQSGPPWAPNLTTADLLKQFRADIFGKEVQTTATYSYTWVADQMRHICIGILLNFILAFVAHHALALLGVASTWWGEQAFAVVAGSAAVCYWEYRTYQKSVEEASHLFPVGRTLLFENAMIASAYMIVGVLVGMVFHLRSVGWAIGGFAALLVVVVVCAPPWLRQKITWQRAGLPYLFRLADQQRWTIRPEERAKDLQAIIDGDAPGSGVNPRQIVIGGPIGSGRTSLAAGIGTEFAFKKRTVRYIRLAALLEFAAQHPDPKPPFPDDTGPANLSYWRWSEAQVVIIDDIGPLLRAQTGDQQDFKQQFRALILDNLCTVKPVFSRCHSVWVLGDLGGRLKTTIKDDALIDVATAIKEFCEAKEQAVLVELPAGDKGAVAPAGGTVPRRPRLATIRSV